MAESLEPDQVIDVLNHYLSEMSDAIMGHGGTLVADSAHDALKAEAADLEDAGEFEVRGREAKVRL